jgi:hypothetical protein
VFGECHYCHGPVSAFEEGDLLLDDHGDHEVYLHVSCGVGHDVVEEEAERLRVTCPECGAVETH